MSSVMSPSGLDKPANPDTGATFWDDLRALFQAFNDHTHSGADSSLTGKRQTIAAGSWASQGNGVYKQTVSMTAGLTYDNVAIQIRNASGHVVYPTIEKVSSTTYDIYTNDNSESWTAVYT